MATNETVSAWFKKRVPKSWISAGPHVRLDSEEIVVVLPLADAKAPVAEFREQTRAKRMDIARAAEREFGRKVSWGVTAGGADTMFTSVSTPVMTRLRFDERAVLDTLVSAGVARSRSDALAWCVRLVGRHEGDWLENLRDALVHVDRVRAEGPTVV